MPRTKKTPEEPKLVAYKNLQGLKLAKTRKTAPRGLEAVYDKTSSTICFQFPKQSEPVLRLDATEYLASCLKSDGFKLKGDDHADVTLSESPQGAPTTPAET